MKVLSLAFLSVSCLLASHAAFATVKIQTDCGTMGPTESNLAVSVDSAERQIQVGYLVMGVFEPMTLVGCQSVRFAYDTLVCDGGVLATLGKFESTEDDDGTPRASMAIHPSQNVSITGECKYHHSTLKLEVLK